MWLKTKIIIFNDSVNWSQICSASFAWIRSSSCIQLESQLGLKGEISVMCLGASEFKFLVAWVCNHQSQPTMQEWSRNTFPELALVLLPGTWSPTAIGEMTK